MTDRLSGFVVALQENIREDDAEAGQVTSAASPARLRGDCHGDDPLGPVLLQPSYVCRECGSAEVVPEGGDFQEEYAERCLGCGRSVFNRTLLIPSSLNEEELCR